MRRFAADCLLAVNANSLPTTDKDTCTTEGCHGDEDAEKNVWRRQAGGETGVAELVTVNPAFGEGLRGVRILQQAVPFRTSKLKVWLQSQDVGNACMHAHH